MRESIGASWMVFIAISMLLFMISFIAFSVNYARVFAIKNEIINIIESEEGYTNTAITKIDNYLVDVGYITTGPCDINIDGVSMNRDGSPAIGPGVYCVRTVEVDTGGTGVDNIQSRYYKITLFFRLSLPTVENLFTIKISGETNNLSIVGGG